MRGILKIQGVKLMRLVRKSPIHGVCTICMGTSGNGCKILGMHLMTVLQQMEVLGKLDMAPTRLNGAVAGRSTPWTAVRRFAAWRGSTIAASTSRLAAVRSAFAL